MIDWALTSIIEQKILNYDAVENWIFAILACSDYKDKNVLIVRLLINSIKKINGERKRIYVYVYEAVIYN